MDSASPSPVKTLNYALATVLIALPAMVLLYKWTIAS